MSEDASRVLDEWDRNTDRVVDGLVYADEHNWDALVAAVRAGLALHVPSHGYCVVCDRDRDVEQLGNDPSCQHSYSYCRDCDRAWPCPTDRALSAPLGQPTTDEETHRG